MSASAAYDARAAEYTALLGAMSAVHPLDRHIVEAWAAQTTGCVLDAGCGPGHWTNHLVELGLSARGIDLAPTFIDHARAAYPGVPFAVHSIDGLDETDGSLGGILAWFSTIHHGPDDIATPIAEFARVLRPGGLLMLGYFSAGVTERFDHAVVRAYRWRPEDLSVVLERAGFEVVETHVRTTRGERPVGTMLCERRILDLAVQ